MIQISIDESKKEYRPGEMISGNVTWSEHGDESFQLETRLIWYTEGKGDQDFKVVATQPVENTTSTNSAPFQFRARGRPFSFSGKLISLIWAIEVVQFPSREGYREQISISNLGKEIILDKSFEDSALAGPLRKVN